MQLAQYKRKVLPTALFKLLLPQLLVALIVKLLLFYSIWVPKHAKIVHQVLFLMLVQGNANLMKRIQQLFIRHISIQTVGY